MIFEWKDLTVDAKQKVLSEVADKLTLQEVLELIESKLIKTPYAKEPMPIEVAKKLDAIVKPVDPITVPDIQMDQVTPESIKARSNDVKDTYGKNVSGFRLTNKERACLNDYILHHYRGCGGTMGFADIGKEFGVTAWTVRNCYEQYIKDCAEPRQVDDGAIEQVSIESINKAHRSSRASLTPPERVFIRNYIFKNHQRFEGKLSSADIAELFGLSKTTINNIINADVVPRIEANEANIEEANDSEDNMIQYIQENDTKFGGKMGIRDIADFFKISLSKAHNLEQRAEYLLAVE